MIKLIKQSQNYKIYKQPMNVICNACSHKEQLINKYTKLIKLLKTKHQKSSKSTIKSQNFSTQSNLQSCESSVKNSLSNIQPEISEAQKGQIVSIMVEERKQNSKLAIIVICNKVKRSLLKQCFDQIKSTAPKKTLIKPYCTESSSFSNQNPSSILNLIEETASHGRMLQQKSKYHVMTLNQIYKNQFYLENLNIQLRKKVDRLEQDLKESEKRFQKQTEKKRQGLEAVAQEIREKNDFIAELQHTIKQYQKFSGQTFQKIHLQNVLIQDQLELKKTCLRLQTINDKLNSDLRNAQAKTLELKSQIQLLKKQNINLKTQLTSFKELNFDLHQQINKNQNLAQTYTNLCQKLNQKLEKIKLTEKKGIKNFKSNLKQSDIMSCRDIISLKNTQNSSDSSPLSQNSSFRQLEAQQKIESIFSFIFNIHEEVYQINNPEMFDSDELNLLKSHKNSFLNNIHNQKSQKKIRTQKIIKNSNLDQTDQIFYAPQHKNSVENSFFYALEPENNLKSKPIQVCKNLKLMNLQIQNSKLIEKISDLKKVYMHIRDILLKFLKTIQLTNLKSETVQILQIIFDVFEYSEDEKFSLIKEKKKKLWGIL